MPDPSVYRRLNSVLEFHEDALALSGVTGTKPKCEIIGAYYPLWWEITSGGPGRGHSFRTAIVDMNAGTGEDYIEDSQQTILGSAGHALKLKLENPNASNLKVILVEESKECFHHLKNVIRKRWPFFHLGDGENSSMSNRSGVYLLNEQLRVALEAVQQIELGNSLFFFDPLLFTPWSDIESVADRRLRRYYQTGTEFIVFLFTSDWFQGRGELMSLPQTNDQTKWSKGEKETVAKMDELFGWQRWRSELLGEASPISKVEKLVGLYRDRLHKWFRYVLPLPFEPKAGQRYHLFMCSNYEDGIGITKRFYVKFTRNSPYAPDPDEAYARFATLHPEKREMGKRRPGEWKILWRVIKDHDQGICDVECKDIREIEADYSQRERCLEWLRSKGYFVLSNQMTDVWNDLPRLYRLDWRTVEKNLGAKPPLSLEPLKALS